MEIQWNSPYLDVQNLVKISRGDKNRMLKYIHQFQALIPKRMIDLKEAIGLEDRNQVQELLHQMVPQIHFFGIPNVLEPIQKLELEFLNIPMYEMKSMVEEIIKHLHQSMTEIDKLSETYFNGKTIE